VYLPVGLDVRDAAIGAHFLESPVGDAGGVALYGVLVSVEDLGAMTSGVHLGYRRGVSTLLCVPLLEEDCSALE
jgi:hypothetical protein